MSPSLYDSIRINRQEHTGVRIRAFLVAAAGLAAAAWVRAGESGVGIEAEVENREAVTPDEPAKPTEPPKPPVRPNPTYIEGRGFDFRSSDGLFDFAIYIWRRLAAIRREPPGIRQSGG